MQDVAWIQPPVCRGPNPLVAACCVLQLDILGREAKSEYDGRMPGTQ